MNNMLIKVTVIGIQTNVNTTFFDSPKISLVNPLKIWSAIPGKKGTEIRDESGKNILIVSESPEAILRILNKE